MIELTHQQRADLLQAAEPFVIALATLVLEVAAGARDVRTT